MYIAKKIKMKPGCYSSFYLMEIDKIYIEGMGCSGFVPKEELYDFVVKNPNSIVVNISPYPVLIPAKSKYGEKYVKSSPDRLYRDNLLNLPRE